MNILLAGDTHMSLGHFQRLFAQARKNYCQRIFQLGDFGYWPHTADGVQFLRKLERLAAANEIPVYWLRGNHDKVSWLRQHCLSTDDEGFILISPNVRFAEDGHRWEWSGVKFLAFGGAYSVDKDSRLSQENEMRIKIRRQNAYRRNCGLEERSEDTSGVLWFHEEEASDEVVTKILEDPSPVDILLTHDKPRRVNLPGLKDFALCIQNQKRVDALIDHLSPKVVVHGHLHVFYKDVIEREQPGQEPLRTVVLGLGADVHDAEHSYLVCELDALREKFS